MNSQNVETYTAFDGETLITNGPLESVILKAKKRRDKFPNSSILIFADSTSRIMDLDLSGSEKEVLQRLHVFLPKVEPAHSGPGRPKLGVVAREVSLLPRHWEWLATQNGGASATLRRLVEEAKKKTAGQNEVKETQEKVYRFMSVMAGDREGFEEALRMLYKQNREGFDSLVGKWPKDIFNHIKNLTKSIW